MKASESKFTSGGVCKRCSRDASVHVAAFAACPDLAPRDRGFQAKPEMAGHPRFYQIIETMSSLHDQKNTDYAAGTAEGPLGNFTRVSQIMRLYPGFDWASPFGAAMAGMLKQLDAAFTLRAQKRESVTGEPIASRLMDVAVYATLGIILEEEER